MRTGKAIAIGICLPQISQIYADFHHVCQFVGHKNRRKSAQSADHLLLLSWLPSFLIHLSSIMTDPFNFADKVVLVTGSSRGIGAEMIKTFGQRGANCVVNYISDSAGQNKSDAETVVKELKSPLMIDCDVTNPQQVETMMKQITERFGGLDILVNNSGIIRDRTIKKLTTDEFESIIRVNLTGTFNVTQKAAAVFRNGGRIINMSSVSGQMGLFGQANYSSSKAAIIALTKVSAREFARQNITVNAIAPGFIDVGMSKGMPDEVTENFKKQIPLGRLGDVSEVVNAALFLASPMASYITGHVLNVNGGYYMG
jgi:3-oxoacyl-[acyl-carrier protein] reductase